jgi:hypothetical protein
MLMSGDVVVFMLNQKNTNQALKDQSALDQAVCHFVNLQGVAQ